MNYLPHRNDVTWDMVKPSLSSEGKQYTIDSYLIANKIHAPMIITIKYIHVELFSPWLPRLQGEPDSNKFNKIFVQE